VSNSHEFKLRVIQSFLEILLKENFIKYHLPNLLRETCLIVKDPIFAELKQLLMQPLGSSAGLLISLNGFVENQNKEASLRLAEKEKNTTQKKPATGLQIDLLVDTEKSLPANSYFWVETLKYVIQNGCILKLKEHAVKAAFRIFVQQLQQIQEMAKRDANVLSRPEVSGIFLEFIGQLCAIGQKQSAQVIHQFLHFGIRTTLQHSNSPSFIDKYSVGLGGRLCDALELTGRITASEPSEVKDLELEKLKTASKEGKDYKFLTKLTAVWLKVPVFQQPFDPAFYHPFKQNAEAFQRELEIVNRIEDALLTAPHAQLEQGLAHLKITTIPVQTTKDPKADKHSNGNGLKAFLFGSDEKKKEREEKKEKGEIDKKLEEFQYLSYTKPLPLPPSPPAEPKRALPPSPASDPKSGSAKEDSDKKGKKRN
jgi:hypothetical protein